MDQDHRTGPAVAELPSPAIVAMQIQRMLGHKKGNFIDIVVRGHTYRAKRRANSNRTTRLFDGWTGEGGIALSAFEKSGSSLPWEGWCSRWKIIASGWEFDRLCLAVRRLQEKFSAALRFRQEVRSWSARIGKHIERDPSLAWPLTVALLPFCKRRALGSLPIAQDNCEYRITNNPLDAINVHELTPTRFKAARELAERVLTDESFRVLLQLRMMEA